MLGELQRDRSTGLQPNRSRIAVTKVPMPSLFGWLIELFSKDEYGTPWRQIRPHSRAASASASPGSPSAGGGWLSRTNSRTAAV
jgi:hypothetical protein